MKQALILLLSLIVFNAFSQTVITKSGAITTNETWSADTVKVTGHITVNNGVTLKIDPGVYVEFQGHYEINVPGRILAQGTPEQRIYFIAKDSVLGNKTGGWQGIRLRDMSATDTSKIVYCIIKFAYAYGSMEFDNDGSGLFITNGKSLIANNLIYKNKGGSIIYTIWSTPVIINNIIYNNTGAAVYFYHGGPKLINNTIANNTGRGLTIRQSRATIINNIIANNNIGNFFSYTGLTDLQISYNNIPSFSPTTNGNIATDPLFDISSSKPFSLTPTSPCLNAGDPSWTIDNCISKTDILGKNRIYISGTNPYIDMGAYEYQNNPDPWMKFSTLNNRFIKYDSLFKYAINPNGYPTEFNYEFITKPDGLSIQSDTICWIPTRSQEGSTYEVSVKIKNGILTDTISFNIYVERFNEFGELPQNDITWDADTIKVLNNLTIAAGKTLTVNGGTVVEFQNRFKITVMGNLQGNGTPENRILFTSKTPYFYSYPTSSGGWSGINFPSAARSPNPNNFKYCDFKNLSTYVITASFEKTVNLSSCNFTGSWGIDISQANLFSTNCVFENLYFDLTNVEKCSFVNCTFFWNKSGDMIYLPYREIPLTNCIIQNSYQYRNDSPILNGKFKIKNSNLYGDNIGYQGQMHANPQFVGTGDNPYALKPTSPCINAGKPDWTLDSCSYPNDIVGSTRIYSGLEETIIDMGAYEYNAEPQGYIEFKSFARQFIRFNEPLKLPLKIISYHPKAVTYTILTPQTGLSVANDTLYWTPNKNLEGDSLTISINVSNGKVNKTLAVDFYILKQKEYYNNLVKDMVWSQDTIKVINNITVPDSITLTINPGVIIDFQGYYHLKIDGRLLARGTPDKFIKFTTKNSVLTDSTGGWNGIQFLKKPILITDSSIIEYCILEYGNDTTPTDYYSSIDERGGALTIIGNPYVRIINSVIRYSQSKTEKCAIYIKSNCYLEGNMIIDNKRVSLRIENCSARLINNTIWSSGEYNCLYLDESSSKITNSVCKNFGAYLGKPVTENCYFVNTQYVNLLSPQFDNTVKFGYSLSPFSPCINSGKSNFTIDSLFSRKDIFGNDRFNHGRIDIGAAEYQGKPIAVKSDTFKVNEMDTLGYVIATLKTNYLYSNNCYFKITKNTPNNSFKLDSVTGKLSINTYNDIDYETDSLINIKAIFTDNTYTDTAILSIKIGNYNESIKITPLFTSCSIYENPVKQALIDTFNVKLINKPYWVKIRPQAPYHMYIDSGNFENAFRLDSISGKLFTHNLKAIDYEKYKEFNLKIIATDGFHYDTLKLPISISDINEAPVIYNRSVSVAENTRNGAKIDLLRINQYLGNGILQYKIIEGNELNAFRLDQNTGEVFVNSNIELDYEKNTAFVMKVVVFDDLNSDTAEYKISIENSSYFGSFTGFDRADVAMFELNQTYYIGLGKGADSCYSDFWKYNTKINEWVNIESFPGKARSSAEVFVLNNNAYIGLGWDAFKDTAYNTVYAFNSQTEKWQQLKNFPGETRYDAISFVIDSTAYLGTGKGKNDQLNDIWKYNSEIDQWTQINSTNLLKRQSALAFVHNGIGYIGGGYSTSPDSVQFSDLLKFTPNDETWTKIMDDATLLSINNGAAISEGNEAYLFNFDSSYVASFNPVKNEIKNLELTFYSIEKNGRVILTSGGLAYYGMGMHSSGNYSYFSNNFNFIPLPFSYSPTDIELSKNTVNEGLKSIGTIGTLTTIDKNSGDKFLYELIDADTSFSINVNELQVGFLNYEEKNLYSITIRSTDNQGNTMEKSFDIVVQDRNEAPTSITLSADTVYTYYPIGKVVGTIKFVDEDAEGTHTIEFTEDELTSLEDSKYYIITDSNLIVNSAITNNKTFHELLIKVRDNGNLYGKQKFTLVVIDGVGIKLLEEANIDFTIYPNPTKDILTINANSIGITTKQIKVFDRYGKLVKVFDEVGGEQNQINLSEFNAGIYFMIIETNDKMYYKKVILE